jgi:thioredoxin reductase
MTSSVDVAIIGAGPYGLSLAAHLRSIGVGFRIFGNPMSNWRRHMPKGMLLKSEGFASNLYDPDATLTLARYCAENGIAYSDLGLPVRLETFAAYGLEFQRRFVPALEDKTVIALDRSATGFLLRLSDREIVSASCVVIATGISHFHYVPPVLAALPRDFATHSSEHGELEPFRGRHVTVIGAGASALDIAALLRHCAASIQVVARKPFIDFHEKMRLPRPLIDRVRAPMSGLGPGWRSRLCTDAPLVFHYMPQRFRLEVAKRHLGPAPGWFVKDQIVGHVPLMLGVALKAADVRGDHVHLRVAASDGTEREIVTDHVIAATGYRADLRRLPFLNDDLRAALTAINHTPELSANFESSVPGLYFVGLASANSFGPLARFAFGAKFAARRLARHFTRYARSRPWPTPRESLRATVR